MHNELRFMPLQVFNNGDGRVCISQDYEQSDDIYYRVYLTPEMIDAVCDKLGLLKSEILKEREEE